MTLKLYAHPLSSYCHKALIAFYENDTPFEFLMVGDPTKTDPKVWEEFKTLWPIGKFPVLKDTGRDDWLVPEATIIIEYLAQHYPGKVKLIPDDPDLARRCRMMDRFFDNYLHTPMQKINFDKIRAADQRDPAGVEDAKMMYRTALDMLEQAIDGKQWAMGDGFTMADCAAAPPLFYGNMQMPFEKTHPKAYAYLERLKARPSYARALKEAEPYFSLLPKRRETWMTITITAFEKSPDGGKGLARDTRVRWALEEVGQPYDVRLVSFKAMKEPAHLALHPFGQIPTYEEGDVAIFETGAIVFHIAQRFPGILPDDPAARARAISWIFASLNTIEPPILELQTAVLLDKDKPWAKERLPEVKDRIRNRLKQLSAYMDDADWLDGAFSAGDLMVVSVLLRLRPSGLLDEFPNLAAYVARGEARPAYKRAFAAQLAVNNPSAAQN